MLSFDSVKLRLDRDQSLSYMEFNYMILQAYDFLELSKTKNCLMQIGGSDQWGNIINGVELIKRYSSKQVFGLTTPLITLATGSKMGKTEKGAIWLDEKKLKNFDFYQFWRNIDDINVEKFLKLFTKIKLDEIKKLSELKGEEINEAKKILAYEVTKICRGINAAKEAEDIANNIFNKKTNDDRLITYTVKKIDIEKSNFTILDAVEKLNLSKSRSDTKRLIKHKGIKINEEFFSSKNFSLDKFNMENELKISVGKKNIGILKIKK